MDKRFDILGIGCVAVDDLLFVDDFPSKDSKVHVNRSQRDGGGLTATALVAAARLGGKCAFAGLLGPETEELSAFISRRLVDEQIDIDGVVRTMDARPIHSLIVVSADGSRNIFWDDSYRVGADDLLPDASLIQSSRVLFCDQHGIAGNLRAIRIARAAGIPTVADIESDCDPLAVRFVQETDHLVISREFAFHHTGTRDIKTAISRLWNHDRSAVILTAGREGCWWRSAEEAAIRHTPALEVNAVDTTGCGDVFHGAYALALARQMPPLSRIEFAAVAAALKASRIGGQSGAPRADEVERFLQHQKR